MNGCFFFRLWVALWLMQIPALAQKKYFVSLIDTETELAQSTVYAMFKDSKGFVWFGTAQSLSRFDGSKVKNYPTLTTIPHNKQVNAIVENFNADLWVSIGDYLVRFDRKKEKFVPLKIPTPTGPDFMKGWPIAMVGTKVWCISPLTQEVFCYDYTSRKKTVFLTKIPFLTNNNNYFNGSFYDHKSSLWLHLTEGVLKFDINTFRSTYFFSKHARNQLGEPTSFFSVSLQKDSVILAGTGRTVAMHIDSGEYQVINPLRVFVEQYNSIVTLPRAHFDFRREYGDGPVWIRRSFGVFKLNPLLPKFEKTTQATHEAFTPETSVRSMFSLNDSIVRIGMRNRNYLYNRRSKNFQQISQNHPLINAVGQMLAAKEGYWIASPQKGLALYNPQKNRLQYFPNPDTLKPENRFANLLFKVMEISPDALLISSEAGLFIFYKKTHKYFRIPYFGKALGRYPLQDRAGRLYISNENLHIGRLRDTVWIPEKTLPISHRFRNGFEDTLNQVIWGATTNGLKMIDPKDWSLRVWEVKDGMNNPYIYDVLVDKQGMVWFSTNRGLSRLDLKTKKIDNFKLSDGLQSYEFNSNTAHVASDGEFFFGGVRGFNHFYPENVQFNTHLALPILTDFKVREKPFQLPVSIGEASKIQLNAAESTFSIDYSAIDYFSNGQNTYQYRLKELDSTWIQAKQQTTARFVQVPAGNYTFEVKAANSDGLWNPVPTGLLIEIEPQLWETLWFRVAMLLLLLLGIYGFYRYRLYVIEQRQRSEMTVMVKTQEAERMRFAQDLHDGLGANLSAIKLILGLIDHPESRPFKEKTEAMLDESLDDLRRLIHAMSPRNLERLGLVKALREMTIIINQTGKMDIKFTADDFPESIPSELQINLFRIAQELFQNAIKHAQAKHVTLTLRRLPHSLQLHYTDNGRGFDTTKVATVGNGLSNLQTRSQLINATFDLQSAPNKGTSVRVEVPF